MTKKIGIITLNGYFNYGNRLQNYALQNIVKSLGFEVDTIVVENINKKTCKEETLKEKLRRRFSIGIRENIKIINNRLNRKKYIELDSRREKVFRKFTSENIDEIKVNNLLNLNNEYDYFITGSDQVWNPNDPTVSEVNFLTFTDKEKRIAYAPSFGVSAIPKEYIDDYTRWLSDINYISVREDAGSKIIKELTGKEVPVVIDPTMMLTKQKWLSVSKESKTKPKVKYILIYLLGGGSKEQKQKIKEISNKYNLEVVNLASIRDVEHYITGPSEFIDYINYASVFFTDSFHGCVFSMLLDTPIVVCTRSGQDSKTSMESRIDTFLNKFKLQDRRYSNIDNIDIFSCDYTNSNELLDIERKKAWDYLSNALSSNKEFIAR